MKLLDRLIGLYKKYSNHKILYFGKVLRDGNVALLKIKNLKHYKSSIKKKSNS